MRIGAPPDEADGADVEPAGWFGSLGSIIGLLFVAWAARLAMLPLNDNSFFTHLATGRLILDEGRVPSRDPYTFTAAGESWTVQSWLASVGYAGAERLGGALGIKLLVLAVFVVATAVLWALSASAASLLPRLAVVGLAFAVFSSTWSERPYMVGIVGLGMVLLVLRGRIPAWTLVPLGWVWTNSHGSFVLGGVLIAIWTLGAWLDERGAALPSGSARIGVRTGIHLGIGILSGAISPLGVRALLFPVEAFGKSDVLAQIVEWQAPGFTSPNEYAYLVAVALSVVALVRIQRWSATLPVLAFVVASLLAQRNVVLAMVVLVPVLADASPRVGTLRSDTRPSLGPPLAVVTLALVALVVATGSSLPRLGLGGYPVRALAVVDASGVQAATATQDFTGNFLEVLDGPTGAVFIDDRVDMFPAEVVADFQVLNGGGTNWRQILDDRSIDRVIWKRAASISSLLALDRDWSIVYSDSTWMVACRRGTCTG